MINETSWTLVSAWRAPIATASWDSTERWAESLTEVTATARRELAQLRSQWDHELADLGGDPTAVDWTAFRPLRRDREADWSD